MRPYSGIKVPDELWSYAFTGIGAPCSDNQAEVTIREDRFMAAFDAWTDRFAVFVATTGKVEPGRYRAYGYTAPGHPWADTKLKPRETRLKAGYSPPGSSPARQRELGLSNDAGLDATESGGRKLRDRCRRARVASAFADPAENDILGAPRPGCRPRHARVAGAQQTCCSAAITALRVARPE